MQAGDDFCQLHQILAVRTDICAVRVDRALAAVDRPLKSTGGGRRRNGKAVADTGLDLGALFIIVPGYKLQIG